MKASLLCFFVLGVCAWSVPCAAASEKEEADAAPLASISSMSTSPDAAPHTPQKPPVIAQLESLVAGLQMPSETDAPIRVFWTAPNPHEKRGRADDEDDTDELHAADYARMAGLHFKGNEPAEARSLSELLDQAATEQTWMSEDEKKTAHRFADLRAFLSANFAEIEVFAWGTTEKQIVVAGRTEGGFAGLVTLVVET